MGAVCLEHLLKGELANDVTVQDEEDPIRVISDQMVTSEADRTSRTHGLCLQGAYYFDIVAPLELLGFAKDSFSLVINGEDYFYNSDTNLIRGSIRELQFGARE